MRYNNKSLTSLREVAPFTKGGSHQAGDFKNGFTLVEVLVALVILATSFMALIEIAGNHTANLSYLRDKTFAHWVAMNKLAETRIAKVLPEIGKSDGSMMMGKKEWFWEQTVSETEIATIRRIEVAIKHKQEDENTVIKRTAFIQKQPKKQSDVNDNQPNNNQQNQSEGNLKQEAPESKPNSPNNETGGEENSESKAPEEE